MPHALGPHPETAWGNESGAVAVHSIEGVFLKSRVSDVTESRRPGSRRKYLDHSSPLAQVQRFLVNARIGHPVLVRKSGDTQGSSDTSQEMTERTRLDT